MDNLKHISNYPIIIENTTVKIDTRVSSDASGSGLRMISGWPCRQDLSDLDLYWITSPKTENPNLSVSSTYNSFQIAKIELIILIIFYETSEK